MTTDIRPVKMRLRKESKEYRLSLSAEEKQRNDRKIANKLLNLWTFRDAQTLLAYMSTEIEVDTRYLIERAWKLGKKVAVPRCIAGTRNMVFQYISSFDDLENGAFGVLEPIADRCPEVTCFDNCICVVPALVFDKKCFRLGYGKGYYDRFLASFSGAAIGVCYEACRKENIPHGKYDKSLDLFITETRIYTP
ncbi:MAG: 5-formyltetrahydrofolate cyclo-ligase [Clostridia bacterium]|nr:5-formyltetrahydrofolate cyclo-ligase [Clostridia bacterium]MBR3954237.1 5-formyltetrahydrofolate cyclo-ligase [Clostridia bacterium]